MAKIELSPIFTQVRGRIGRFVLRKNGEDTALGRMPTASLKAPTAAQLEVHAQFRAAAAYAKRMLADPIHGPRYVAAAHAKGMRTRAFAFRDFFKEPVVQQIDVSDYHGAIGQLIKVQAYDDFDVTGVHVAVLDGENAVIFQGPAVLTNELWQLAAPVGIAVGEEVTIRATATDRPGHTGTLSQAYTIV